jgi:hypothetical protein
MNSSILVFFVIQMQSFEVQLFADQTIALHILGCRLKRALTPQPQLAVPCLFLLQPAASEAIWPKGNREHAAAIQLEKKRKT